MDVEDKMGEEKTSAFRGTTIKRFCFCLFCNKKGVTGSANG